MQHAERVAQSLPNIPLHTAFFVEFNFFVVFPRVPVVDLALVEVVGVRAGEGRWVHPIAVSDSVRAILAVRAHSLRVVSLAAAVLQPRLAQTVSRDIPGYPGIPG